MTGTVSGFCNGITAAMTDVTDATSVMAFPLIKWIKLVKLCRASSRVWRSIRRQKTRAIRQQVPEISPPALATGFAPMSARYHHLCQANRESCVSQCSRRQGAHRLHRRPHRFRGIQALGTEECGTARKGRGYNHRVLEGHQILNTHCHCEPVRTLAWQSPG